MHARTVPYLPPSPVTLRTQVDLVEVPVVVRDGHRHAVAGLTKDAFEIYDSGKKQTITAFSVQTFTPRGGAAGGTTAAPDAAEPKGQPRPRFVALLFDDLHLDAAGLKPAKEAAEQFVKTSLAPGDRAAVFTTARSSSSEFTGDVPRVVEQIAGVTPAPRGNSDNSPTCPRIQPYEAYQIATHMDPGNQVLQAKIAECVACTPQKPPLPCSVTWLTGVSETIWEQTLFYSDHTRRAIQILVDAMAKLPGQRMILLTSAGFLTATRETDMDVLMAKALHAEVVINALDAKGLYTAVPGGDDSERSRLGRPSLIVDGQTANQQPQARDDGMAVLAAGTGGNFYHDTNDLLRGFRELGMVPETIYVLSFTPSDVVSDGRFHSLRVRLVAGKRFSLQARLGYTAPAANAAPVSPPSKLDSEIMASETIADLPAAFTWEQRSGPPSVTMVAHLDIANMHFATTQGRGTQKLTIVGVLLDSRGGFVAGERTELDLNFTVPTFMQVAKTGLNVILTLEAPPGSYSVRAVARDALEGKLAAASGSVQIK
jgi:VWFA-related protein